MTAPDSAGSYTTEDGYEIPMGVGAPSNVARSSLLYNEYPFLHRDQHFFSLDFSDFNF